MLWKLVLASVCLCFFCGEEGRDMAEDSVVEAVKVLEFLTLVGKLKVGVFVDIGEGFLIFRLGVCVCMCV